MGDIHGQLEDLLIIFEKAGLPSKSNPYVFNGDFVDRGDNGVEVMAIYFMFQILYPEPCVHQSRKSQGLSDQQAVWIRERGYAKVRPHHP